MDFHSFRYFFCTLLARKLPLQVVRLLMRHGDIHLTCNLYMDLGLSDLNDATLKLPRLLDDAPKFPPPSSDAQPPGAL